MGLEHAECVVLSDVGVRLAIASNVYDTILLEEQRINREIRRLEERLAQNQVDRARYELIIRRLTNK